MDLRLATTDDAALIKRLKGWAYRRLEFPSWYSVFELWHRHPFLLLFDNDVLAGALAVHLDAPPLAWLWAYFEQVRYRLTDLWPPLWAAMRTILRQRNVRWVRAVQTSSRLAPIFTEPEWLQDGQLCSFTAPVNALCFSSPQLSKHPGRLAPLSPESAPAIEQLDRMLFPDTHVLSAEVIGAILQNRGQGWGIRMNGQWVAWILVLRPRKDTMHIARLGVHPHYQRRGLAQRLLAQVHSIALDAGCQRITVNTLCDNIAAIHLYRKVGFQPDRSVPLWTCPLHAG